MFNKFRIYHSFWSKPLLQKRYAIDTKKQLVSTLLFTAIGVIAAKKLNIEIVLHTDDYGALLFDNFPYDNIYTTLSGHDINPQFWASGKMRALAVEPLGSCHLDLDAWIKYPKCRDIIHDSQADIVVQSLEDSRNTYNPIKDFVFNNVEKPDFINIERANNTKAYNCGLVRINNQQLKDKWLEAYWKITYQLNDKNPSGIDEKYCIPDLISEQWLLYQICEQQKFSVDTICNGWGCPLPSIIGFTHLISEHKYNIDNQLKDILLNLNKELYNMVINKVNELS